MIQDSLWGDMAQDSVDSEDEKKKLEAEVSQLVDEVLAEMGISHQETLTQYSQKRQRGQSLPVFPVDRLIAQIMELIDPETGNLTRGTDVIRKMLESHPTNVISALLRWANIHPNPTINRFVMSEISAELRSRGVNVQDALNVPTPSKPPRKRKRQQLYQDDEVSTLIDGVLAEMCIASLTQSRPVFVVDAHKAIAKVIGWEDDSPIVIYPGKSGGIRAGSAQEGGGRPYEYKLKGWKPATVSDFSRIVKPGKSEKIQDLRRWQEEFLRDMRATQHSNQSDNKVDSLIDKTFAEMGMLRRKPNYNLVPLHT